MNNLTNVILHLRDYYVNAGIAESYEDINCGSCVDFAEGVEALYSGLCESLSNDHLVIEREGSDGWDGEGEDVWSEEWLSFYGSLPPAPHTINDLTDKITGYHFWLFYNGKHYDSECPEGVSNLFDLPFFKRCLSSNNNSIIY